MRGQRHAPAAPYSQEGPGTSCTGGHVYYSILQYNLLMTSDLETVIFTISNFTDTIWQFAVYCQYSCESALMLAAVATETCI